MCNCGNLKTSQDAAKQYASTNGAADMAGVGVGSNAYRRPSLLEELEKRQTQANEDESKRYQAIHFFRANPAFDEFIQLIRSGSIHI